jgi:hypothetical protein
MTDIPKDPEIPQVVEYDIDDLFGSSMFREKLFSIAHSFPRIGFKIIATQGDKEKYFQITSGTLSISCPSQIDK